MAEKTMIDKVLNSFEMLAEKLENDADRYSEMEDSCKRAGLESMASEFCGEAEATRDAVRQIYRMVDRIKTENGLN